jgi:hypothetical protein
MDTIGRTFRRFLPANSAFRFFPQNQQVVQANATTKPLTLKCQTDRLSQLDVTGVEGKCDPLDSSVIWLKDAR